METIKLLPSSKKINTSSFLGKEKKETGGINISSENLNVISTKVITIEKLLEGQNKLLRSKTTKVKKEEETQKRSKKESELEKPKDKEEKDGRKLLKGPKLGFLDRIKNFLGKMILGFIAVRLIPYLPELLKIIPKIAAVNEFFIDAGMGLVDGLATFVQKGYEAYDFTRKSLKNFGGDNLLKLFDSFNGAVGKLIEASIIAALAFGDLGGGDGGGPGGGRPGRGGYRNGVRTGQYNGFNTRTTRSGNLLSRTGDSLRAQRGDWSTSGYIKSEKDIMKRYFQKYGRDAFVQRFGQEGLEALPGGMARSGLTKAARGAFVGVLGKGGAKSVLGFVRPLLKRIPIPVVGALIDFGLSVALGESPGRAAFKAIGAGLLGTIGAALGGPFAVLTGIAGGMLGDWAGGALYDVFFGNKKPQKPKGQGRAEGGAVTRSGKLQGSVSRRVKKTTAKRVVKPTATKLKPGSSVGGKQKLENVFPETDKQGTVNPLGYIEDTYDKTNKIQFFGPIFDIAYKTIAGDKPTRVDYKNASIGLNSWMNDTFNPEVMRRGGFAGGGEVNAEMFMKGEDLTNVIAKSLEDNISTKIDDAINELQKQLGLKPLSKPAGVPGPTEPGPGDLVNIQGGDADFWTLVAVASREDGEPQAWADVAQSIYNRLASGAYTGKTIKDLILGQMQYEPTWKFPRPGVTGKPNQEWYAIKDAASAGIAAGQSEAAMKKVAAAILDPSLQKNAREFIQGRTDFRGYSVSGGVQRKPGDNYYGWYNNYTANKIGSVPNFGATATSTGGAGPSGGTFLGGGTGSGYGTGGVKIAGDLGDYMKANRGKIGVTGSIHQHPRHPGQFRRGYFSYHNQNRALDIGGYGPAHPSSGGRDEQAPVIRALLEWNKKNGYKPVEIIHGSPAFKGLGKYESASNALHSNHVHVAYSRGGLVRGFTIAILGERGIEFVLDNDTTVALQKTFPGFLDALNRANFNDAVTVLRNYASYEVGAMQEVQINNNIINVIAQDSAPQTIMIGGDGGMDDFTESLAAGH